MLSSRSDRQNGIIMDSTQIRSTFLEFFRQKQHNIVSSAPMVNKDDPTLMFTNAGMNQFKDYFLGNLTPEVPRIADTQKCLRVSGKHNDLEEVGLDSYHHTMFEMLGNWSIGDYFKEEAITWAWELLTEVYGLPKDKLYITVFGGDEKDQLEADVEAEKLWQKIIPADRVLRFDRKDNFWEMGETGPCGPCSEIHIDLRSEEERLKINGADLVNMDDPLVVEIWNLVFIQFNRKEGGKLENLPASHIDTGMGFERLAMAIQKKTSNYDTDVFSFYIDKIEKDSGIKYKGSYAPDAYSDIAMRVIADHVRATSFAIADGALPSNTGAGYVIRRILRRAIRYYYSYLNIQEPYIHNLVPLAADYYADIFPEFKAQESFIKQIIEEEEKSFLRTLAKGLARLERADVKNNTLTGEYIFELYDTYGFPFDLTRLIASEKGWEVDEKGFNAALNEQKERGRKDAKRQVGDWTEVKAGSSTFMGYDHSELAASNIIKYRSVTEKDKPVYHVVLDKTPFYPEGGGQIGDIGKLVSNDEEIQVLDTYRENELIIHRVDKIPSNPSSNFKVNIDSPRRRNIERNHSATHLLHAALRDVLGEHVQQKGSLVSEKYLRFDFSHFSKVTDEELYKIEKIVNQKIRENIHLDEARSIPIEEAKASGAMMLFGEKYGDQVRMITFDPTYSRELCGGCHVSATGIIGYLKITSESAVASGIRRIEAVTGQGAEAFIDQQSALIKEIGEHIKQQDLIKGIQNILDDNKRLSKELDGLKLKLSAQAKSNIINEAVDHGDHRSLFTTVENVDSKVLKDMIFQLEKELTPCVIGLGSIHNEKPTLMVAITKQLVESKSWHAGNMVREAAQEIKGGGGGQAFFASAGGSDSAGLESAIAILKKSVE